MGLLLRGDVVRCGHCRKELQIGDYPYCPHDPVEPRNASVHASERVVVNVNPQTGEVRIPGRADRAIDPKYAAAGYVRQELNTLAEVRKLEKRHGLVHEASNFDNSGRAERETGSR